MDRFIKLLERGAVPLDFISALVQLVVEESSKVF